jgi:DNA-binding CsgD family transcriptional regulator
MSGATSKHDNELVLDVLGLDEPAFAVNSSLQIVAWNDSAGRLLGLRAEDVIGMRCYEALALANGVLGVDCSRICGQALMPSRVANDSPNRVYAAVNPPAPQSAEAHVKVTTIPAHTRTGQPRFVHFLHDLRGLRDTDNALEPRSINDHPEHDHREPATPPLLLASRRHGGLPLDDASESGGKLRRPALLTQRELEVLRLLGAGHSTDDIARELSITRVTARNHVNKVLDKLGVNSRLQAVVIASQLRLI